MQINSNMYSALNEYNKSQTNSTNRQNNKESDPSVEEMVAKSTAQVSISMNAQFMAFMMESSSLQQSNTFAQNDLLSFLNGGVTSDGYNLSSTGYSGKPITTLSQSEAKELISEDGFFGVKQTSERIANFVLNFAGDNLSMLEKGREGVERGFKEAKGILGDSMAEISYTTQERALQMIDEKIASLKEPQE